MASEGFVHKMKAVRKSGRDHFAIQSIPKPLINKLILPNTLVLVEANSDLVNQRKLKRDGKKKNRTDEGLDGESKRTINEAAFLGLHVERLLNDGQDLDKRVDYVVKQIFQRFS